MSDERLKLYLRSMGMSCFVRYYHLWSSDSVDAIETLKTETDYTETSCRTRTAHGRAIINAGRGHDGLQIVLSSESPLITKEIRDAARSLL
jgi:hypothetical protein